MRSFIAFLTFSAATSAAVAGGKQYRSPDEVVLPPQSQRQVIGTWYDKDTNCTRSFESVNKAVFQVLRCSDGSGGDSGKELQQSGGTKFRAKSGSRHGDYYVIESDGKLGIYDSQGVIDRLPAHPRLRP